MTNRYDVLVIGAGHNGLTTAALLAKKGRRVLVVEARDSVGGLAASLEFYPGYRAPGILDDTALVRSWVTKKLELEKHGLVRRASAPDILVPQRESEALVLPGAVDGKLPAEHGFGSHDVRSYGRYAEFLSRLRPVLRRFLDHPPPDIVKTDIRDALGLARIAIGLRMLGKRDMMEVMRIAPMCVADWLGEWFDSEALKAALAAPALHATYTGPRSPGSNANLLLRSAVEGPPLAGGAPALISALEGACQAQGVEIRTGAAVERILVEGGSAAGVRLDGGEILKSELVAASCDPKQLFLKLLAPAAVSRNLAWATENIRARGTSAKIHLALSGYPEFSRRAGQEFEKIRIGESLDDLERAFDPVKYRRFTEQPALDVFIPTLERPELAPAGHHVASILTHFVPRNLDGGWHEDQKKELLSRVLSVLSEHAPGVRELVVGSEVWTPEDLEAEYRLSGGHLHHGEHALDQLLIRPNPVCGRYETPIARLYLCGSGSHPGGALTCGPGALAAKAING